MFPMSEHNPHRYLRMTIDVVVFEGGEKVATKVAIEGKGPAGTGERLARRFMEEIIDGNVEIDDIRDVEVH